MSSDGRNRRLLGSSDDNGGLTDDGFINHDFRVRGPNICPLPARTYEIQDSHPLYLIIDALEHRMQTWIFAVLRDDVVKLLDQARLPMVTVEISTASHWEEEPLVQVDLDSLHGLNRLYQTIAPRRNDDTWGTLAGFVELLELPGTPDGQWEPFALTCYHCVEPYPEREGISYDSKVLLMEESVLWLTFA